MIFLQCVGYDTCYDYSKLQSNNLSMLNITQSNAKLHVKIFIRYHPLKWLLNFSKNKSEYNFIYYQLSVKLLVTSLNVSTAQLGIVKLIKSIVMVNYMRTNHPNM